MPAYDLLAPGLYHRLGYETAGIIEGCPAGIASRCYHKDLQSGPSARVAATQLSP